MRRLGLIVIVVSLGLSLGWSTAAFAAYPTVAPGITTSSGCSVPGGSLTVGGTNFAAPPPESVTLTLNGVKYSTITISAPSFSTTVSIPLDATPRESYTIVATGAKGDSASITITIPTTCAAGSDLAFTGGALVASYVPVPTVGSGGGPGSGLAFTGGSGLAFTPSPSGLAFTGADIAAVSSVGAIALALGGMLILTGRRRRRSTGV